MSPRIWITSAVVLALGWALLAGILPWDVAGALLWLGSALLIPIFLPLVAGVIGALEKWSRR